MLLRLLLRLWLRRWHKMGKRGGPAGARVVALERSQAGLALSWSVQSRCAKRRFMVRASQKVHCRLLLLLLRGWKPSMPRQELITVKVGNWRRSQVRKDLGTPGHF